MGTWLVLLVLPSVDEGMHRGCSREATLKRVRFGCFVSRVLGEVKNSFCASDISVVSIVTFGLDYDMGCGISLIRNLQVVS
jgi:hypothetical protein